jgi:hypothetical protein
VGIAGEDDLDAPDVLVGPPPPKPRAGGESTSKRDKPVLHHPPTLGPDQSAQLREQMLGEIGTLTVENELLAWAQDGLPRKNALLEADARSIETAYQRKLGEAALPSADTTTNSSQAEPSAPGVAQTAAASFALPKEPVRKRSKAHLSFVRGQPCLVCQQTPSDPHHLKFAQQRALGRKVSDEFTVPHAPSRLAPAWQ